MVTEVRDHDFHLNETRARQFVIPVEGILRLDDSVLVTQGLYAGDVTLRHYAFADRWVKINVTTDIAGKNHRDAIRPRLARVPLQL